MGKKLTDAKREAIARYDAKATRQIHLKLNLKTDAGILEHLEKQDSIQGYIKRLIREDMDAEKNAGFHVTVKTYNGVKRFYCPSCNAEIVSVGDPLYCDCCGQLLNWIDKYIT